MIDDLRAALGRLAPRHRADLERLVRIPSVSAQDRGIGEAASAVAELLGERGFEVAVHQTPGHPVVVAHGGASDGPRMLFYEHYDVQPPDPLDGWTSDPFDVVERDGCLFGRGTADTKAHIVCRLAAVDACREVFGDDPVGYTFLIEGEEEIGSPNLEAFIAEHAADLRADACLWEFGGVDTDGRPQVTLGLKGIATVELTCRGPSYDAHSSLGAAIDNPLYRLAACVASIRDADGRVLIDGFYDDVVPLTQAELDALAAEPDRTGELRTEYGIERFLGGVTGTDLRRRLECEPCVNVNGIHGGYGGPGTKTVLPAEGSVKLDFRLVPNQDPVRVIELLREHLERHGFGDVEVHAYAGEAPGRTPLDDPFVELVRQAAHDVYGKEPMMQVSSAGTGPAHPFREILKVPFATAGCAYPGSRAHAPDEHIRIADFDLAKLHSAVVCARLGAGR